jgi:DNA invertase Pin-like site-specific DNA recombinase
MQRYVIYKRVSTKEQGRSGLGLDAQDRDIGIFLDTFSEEPFEVVGTFTDVQTGSTSDRPHLRDALAMVRRERAVLLVAKLDRLSRKVAFIAALMDDKAVQLRVASMPSADKFQLHIYAALAEQEREFISVRTKAALAEARAKGRQLGGLRDATGKRNEAVQREARARAERVSGIVVPLRRQGASLRQIAEALNASGVPTSRGGEWQAVQVKRTLERLDVG